MPEQHFKVGSVQGLIMIMANFDAAHGIDDPPGFLSGFKKWCEETNTDIAKKKDVRQKLNKLSQSLQQPPWWIEAQSYYAKELDHGNNDLILMFDVVPAEKSETDPVDDTGNDETLSMEVTGVEKTEGGNSEPESKKKSPDPKAKEATEVESPQSGSEQEKSEQPEAVVEGLEDVEKVESVPEVKTLDELDEEKGEAPDTGSDAPEIAGPNDGE